MKAKFEMNQRVKFILAKNQHLHSKYPQFEQYVDQTGVIVDSNWVGIREIEAPKVTDYYIYKVRLDKDGSEVTAVPEDALDIA